MNTNASILVVEDTQSNLDILVDILKMYQMTIALDGPSALELVKSRTIDLILLDIMMPGMDGYEVCKRIKSDPTTRHIPIIFITAKTDEESIESAFSSGGVDYVSKPFKPKELLSRIDTHLTLKKMMSNLEHLVETEIAKRQEQERLLQQQTKMASMGEMMDAVAHQWKQPLNALNLYSDLIVGDFKNGEVNQHYIEQYREDVQMQISHMVETLDEFRTFFRPNTHNTNFDISDTLKSVLVLIKDEFIKHTIEIDIIEKEKLTMYGSENEFKHLLLNLFNNAKDAFIDKKVQDRHISVHMSQDGKKNILKISDNAGGIPAKLLPHIFEAHVTGKSSGKGTGIGLYMSQQIAQKHAASLSANNQNNGACFKLEWFSPM